MSHALDRRSFLRRLGAAGLAAPVLPVLGCSGGEPPESGAAAVGTPSTDGPRVIDRPILVPWADDAVRVLAPVSVLPLAYISRGEQRVYVDDRFRDRVVGMLDVHVSVSTLLWRIPLPGDASDQPLIPGDEEREFVVLPAREWDPSMEPAEGDFRILPGLGANVRLDFECAPISGRNEWVSAGPVDYQQCDTSLPGECREDFQVVATGNRYADRDCTRLAGTVRCLTWTSPEE